MTKFKINDEVKVTTILGDKLYNELFYEKNGIVCGFLSGREIVEVEFREMSAYQSETKYYFRADELEKVK